jgi:hypothetical protein
VSPPSDGRWPSDDGVGCVATPKVLTITLEFKMGSKKVPVPQLKAAYQTAIAAAVDAVKAEIEPGNVTAVQHRVTWDYRWTDVTGQETDDTEAPEWDEGEPSE